METEQETPRSDRGFPIKKLLATSAIAIVVLTMFLIVQSDPAVARHFVRGQFRPTIEALESYRDLLGFYPDHLDELVDSGLIPSIPGSEELAFGWVSVGPMYKRSADGLSYTLHVGCFYKLALEPEYVTPLIHEAGTSADDWKIGPARQ